MAIFKKNANESAFSGGKKNWTDVIKNTGPGELLLWKQPEEDFNTNSTLIVMPGEEAIFINSGTIEQTFENGTYKLSTRNYPFISRLRNAFSGGISVFNSVVYFVRKAHSMEIFWGTDSPVQVRDPKLMISTSVQARGSYKIKIENSGKFLSKLVGGNIPFITQEELNKYFRSEFQQHIKASLAKSIKNSNEEILGICAEQDILAQKLQPILQESLDNYGLHLETFTIAAIDIPENDKSRQMLEDAFAKKGVMNILGDDWGKQQQVEILKDVANNPNSGGLAAAGAGLGMGMAVGGAMGGMATQQMSNSLTQEPSQTADVDTENPVAKIKQLKELLEIDAITQEEFDAKKKEILSKM